MGKGPGEGKELTCPVRIEVVLAVVQVAPWKYLLHMELWMTDHPVVPCHGKMFTHWLLNGDRFLSPVILLCGLTN